MTLEQKREMDLKREMARIMYLHSNLNQKAIAVEVDVSEQTMTAWVNDNNWRDLKKTLSVSQEDIIGRLERLLQSKIEEGERFMADEDPETNPDNDGIVKLAKALDYLKKMAGPSQMYQTGIAFLSWLQRENAELAKLVGPLFKKFIQSLVYKSK